MKNLYLIIFNLFLILTFVSCKKNEIDKRAQISNRDLEQIILSDTLKVTTMYGSTSYFLFRDEDMGFDYEMAENLADFLKVKLKVELANSEPQMIQLLKDGKVDIVAYNIPETKELKKDFQYVFQQPRNSMVIVQRMGRNALSSVVELKDKKVYVKNNSVFHQRLKDLNNEIGGGIQIITVPDSITNDELIEMVANSKIDFTVAYRDKALLHQSYFRRLDCRLTIGFEQNNGWLIRKTSKNLLTAIKEWESLQKTQDKKNRLLTKYWNKSPYFVIHKIKIPKGAISPYDDLFKKYAPTIGWDWRLLAALAFHESRFDSAAISRVGALGLMQLMPQTAAQFGLDKSDIFNPEKNIEASIQYIKSLNMAFSQVVDKNERIKFIIASYNSGPSHILDAMALAQKYGKNPHIWFDNVEVYLLEKRNPEYYNDPVVKKGYYRGTETVRYVENVLDTYEKYLKRK
ncbi:MAG TPA: transglycosylase SLT domain-containing protein [Paludibacteraceae bacterium]|nr:transglycosylase SLT domain-containing protein [Paludibacteraceae bacterium]HOK35952.1 transglycosylase SLT domain-containing protein [Paludibacteraceae bacterium]HOL00604.1 transglycosylase SLT domain-containing protein [Paludibacteraceae bacterium]HPO66793.1 transglycosylase SLT domain-containing protein [Paludibacteraceae bacterium]